MNEASLYYHFQESGEYSCTLQKGVLCVTDFQDSLEESIESFSPGPGAKNCIRHAQYSEKNGHFYTIFTCNLAQKVQIGKTIRKKYA